jgi:2-dehydro-3-deoxy-D-arabinonate dehydratase
MNLCRFRAKTDEIRVGLVTPDSSVIDLTPTEITRIEPLLEDADLVGRLRRLDKSGLPRLPLSEVRLGAPVEEQEVWAAGVTYLRSRAARMAESDFSATAYDRVYAAERPELFFKSLAGKVAGPDETVGIRRDARWSVPEPELALVLNSRGLVVGHTIGNDMSARDIEGENLLYLPQAKTYRNSCALGPWITLGTRESAAREWSIRMIIRRGDQAVFSGETSVRQIKRSFEELAGFLFRSQSFPHGAILLTGTGIVPPDEFTLEPEDQIEIEISGIGRLRNRVEAV